VGTAMHFRVTSWRLRNWWEEMSVWRRDALGAVVVYIFVAVGGPTVLSAQMRNMDPAATPLDTTVGAASDQGRTLTDETVRLLKAGEAELSAGRYPQAQRALEQVLNEIDSSQLYLRARILQKLSLVMRLQGKVKEGVAEARESLQMFIDLQGEDSDEVGHARFTLSSALKEGGQLQEAEQVARTALDAAERNHSPVHPEAIDASVRLGIVLYAEQKVPAATSFLQRAWEARPLSAAQESDLRVLGEVQLGLALFNQGEYSKARPVLAYVVAPLTAKGMDDLAAEVSFDLGVLFVSDLSATEAEPLLSSAYNFYRTKPGSGISIELAASARAMAKLRIVQGMGPDAITLAEEALRIIEQLPPDTTPARTALHAGTLILLAEGYGLNGRFKDADDTLKRASTVLAGRPTLQLRLEWWQTQGKIFEEQAKWKEARRVYEQTLELAVASPGEEDWQVAGIQYKLGVMLTNLGDYPGAERVLAPSQQTFLNKYGKDHLQTARSALALGAIYWAQDRLADADPLLTQAVSVFSQNPQATPRELAKAQGYLGAIRATQRRMGEALELFKASWEFHQKQTVPDYSSVHSAVVLGRAEFLLGHHPEAKTLLQTAYRQMARVHDAADRVITTYLLGQLAHEGREEALAARYDEEAARLCKGPRDRKTVAMCAVIGHPRAARLNTAMGSRAGQCRLRTYGAQHHQKTAFR
jgi:tetratricopeptide (TPR) repeat protein